MFQQDGSDARIYKLTFEHRLRLKYLFKNAGAATPAMLCCKTNMLRGNKQNFAVPGLAIKMALTYLSDVSKYFSICFLVHYFEKGTGNICISMKYKMCK